MTDSVSRLLDAFGTSAGAVVVIAASGVELPRWLVILCAVVSYGTGKASSPGVPFMAKKAASSVIAS